ncbi:MAG: hypothetical protein QOG75_776, partial [Mycobacterium sp.]|nr:hypothetical protein [Mycobacterium sp.]
QALRIRPSRRRRGARRDRGGEVGALANIYPGGVVSPANGCQEPGGPCDGDVLSRALDARQRAFS